MNYFLGYFSGFAFCDYICPTRLVKTPHFFKVKKQQEMFVLACWAKPHPLRCTSVRERDCVCVFGEGGQWFAHTSSEQMVSLVFLCICKSKKNFSLLFVLNKMSIVTDRLLMTMEAGADTQQSGDTAVSESEAQQISLAQVIEIHQLITDD